MLILIVDIYKFPYFMSFTNTNIIHSHSSPSSTLIFSFQTHSFTFFLYSFSFLLHPHYSYHLLPSYMFLLSHFYYTYLLLSSRVAMQVGPHKVRTTWADPPHIPWPACLQTSLLFF